jgi:hypothetical protein
MVKVPTSHYLGPDLGAHIRWQPIFYKVRFCEIKEVLDPMVQTIFDLILGSVQKLQYFQKRNFILSTARYTQLLQKYYRCSTANL